MTEVVVTGLGAVTCHGDGAAALWEAMLAAAARPPDRPRDPLGHMDLRLMHLVPGVDAAERAGRFAITAAAEAIEDAGLDAEPPPARTAVVVGSCMGEVGVRERGRGPDTGDAWNPAFRIAARVGDRIGAYGSNVSVASACAAGGFSVSVGADMIRCGEADVVLAGGSDAYSRVALACFNRLGSVDPVRCRPFDRDRRGTVFAEGAGMLVLESARHAARRGARAYARIAGIGWSCDAYHPTAPEPSGRQIARAMTEALGGDARLGCVIPHATGTPRGDVVESRALSAALGEHLAEVPLYSLKALIGHTGGAAAALALCAATMVLRHRVVPPNVRLGAQDPECAVRLPQDAPVRLDRPRVLVNGSAFGGNNAALVLEEAA